MPDDEVEVIDLTGLEDSSDGDDGPEDDRSSSDEGSAHSEVEIALNETTRAQLHLAISTVSETRLRQVLTDLVDTDMHVEVALARELVTVKRESRGVVPRWETCTNCDEEYDVNLLQVTECIFHPGEQVLDKGNRREYPENFRWTCCDKDGKSSGCVRGEHRPAVQMKRRRV